MNMNIKTNVMINNMYKKQWKTEKDFSEAIDFLKKSQGLNENLKFYMLSFVKEQRIRYRVEKTAPKKAVLELQGLLNLVVEHNYYNNSYDKDRIFLDLKRIKSFKDFRVVGISQYNLNRNYRHLAFKNNAKCNYSKVIWLEKNCFLIKTVLTDGLSLRVICPAFKLDKIQKNLLKLGDKKPNFKKEVGETSKFNYSSLNGWKYLNKGDNIAFYSYLNRNGLDRKNRALLRSIRKMEGGKPSYDVLDNALSRISEIKVELELYYNSNDSSISIGEVTHYEWELSELEEFVSSFGVEDNSMSSESHIEDFLPPVWRENSF